MSNQNQNTTIDPEDTPIGMVVRLRALEKTATDGFSSLTTKLDSLSESFASKADLANMERQFGYEIAALKEKLAAADKNVALVNSRTRDVKIIRSIVYGAAGLVLVTIFGAIIQKAIS